MPTAPAQKRFLTTVEAADELRCCDRTVRNLVAAGKIRATRLGPRLIRIPIEEIERVAGCLDLRSASAGAGETPHGVGPPSGPRRTKMPGHAS